MRFFPIISSRLATYDRNREPGPGDRGHPRKSDEFDEFDPAKVLAKSYADLHDWRTKVEILRDAAKAAQTTRVVHFSLLTEIRLAGEGLDMQLDEFDLAMGKLATKNAVQIQELEALRSGFTKLRVAIDLLHHLLQDDPI